MCLPGLGWACDLAGEAASAAASSVLDAAASSFGSAANDVLQAVNSAIDATTSIDLEAPWFRSNVGIITAIVLPVVMGLFVLQVIGGVMRREPGALGRALWGLVKSLVFSAAAITVAQSLVVATDEMANGVANAAGMSIKDAFSRFLLGSVLTGMGAALEIVMAILLIVGALVVWGTLLLRKAAVLVVAVFAPVAFAGSAHQKTSAWTRRWIETMIALIVTKLAMVVVFVLGASAFGQSGGGGESAGATLSDLLTGVLLVFMTALTPVASYKFLHWAEMEIAGHLHGVMSSSGAMPHVRSAATRGAQMAFAGMTGGVGAATMSAPKPGGTPMPGGGGGGSSRGPGGGGTPGSGPGPAGTRPSPNSPGGAAAAAATAVANPHESHGKSGSGGWSPQPPSDRPLGGTAPA